MSTYYYLICNDCNETTAAASRTAGGYCHLADSDITLLPFIIAHSGHSIEILSEHDDEVYDREFNLWWDKGSVGDMVSRHKEKGNWK